MGKTIYFKRSLKRNAKYGILILFCIIFLLSFVNKSNTVRIVFVGDVLLSRNVKEEYKTRKTFPWEKFKAFFHSSDLVIGNLEGAVGIKEEQINPLLPSPVFAVDSEDIGMLVNAGFTGMVVENNHSLDLGLNGKTKTIATLENNNIKSFSLENSPYFFTIKGYTVSIIAINLILNRDSSKYEFPSIEISQKLRLARSLSNVVIVSIHWGSELLEWPSIEQRNIAKWLILNGTDVIIGHHPHVIQKPELINGKPVYFSLGNHLFDQKYQQTKEGLMAIIEIKNGKIYAKGLKTHTQKNSFFPEIQVNEEKYFQSIPLTKSTFSINNIHIVPENLDVINKIILKGYDKNRLLWKSHPMSLVSLQKIKIDDKEEHLFTLERYYSSLDKEINIRPYVYTVDNNGLTAKWRGSALAFPIVDAQISNFNTQILCALHRGDAFISLGKITLQQKVAAYKWNSFGFNLVNDSTVCKECEQTLFP